MKSASEDTRAFAPRFAGRDARATKGAPSIAGRDARATKGAPSIAGRDARASRSALLGILAVAVFLLFQGAVFAQGGPTDKHEGSSGSVWVDMLIVFALVCATFLFVLAETALLTVRRTRIDQLVEENNRSAVLVQKLLSEPTRMLATLQVGLTLVQLFSAGEAANRFVEPFKAFLLRVLGDGNPLAPYANTISFVTVILTVGLVTLVIGEITPKGLAMRHSESIALRVAWPIRWLEIIARPLVSLVTFMSNLIVRPFGVSATFHASAMSEEELKIMVEQSEEHGVIETEEKQMIHNVFEFADTVVRKVMTPRLDITAIEADVSVDELIVTVTNSGHSRLPVYDDNLDNIVGVVHVKDVLKGITSGSPTSIRDLMRAPFFIPENKRVDDLLTEFRRNKTQIAVVRDEYGTVVGIVTIEDLVEEIVGEIQDEYDVEEPEWRQVDDATCIVDGRMSLVDFNDRMGVELPIDESDTLGGFVFGLLGHQPEQGETATWDGMELQVDETDGKRIQRVRVCRKPGPGDSNGTSGGHVEPISPLGPMTEVEAEEL
jgi:putative hemolysin